jgi:hypothetical protein
LDGFGRRAFADATRLLTMLVEDPKAAGFEIVLVCDDADHARRLLSDLATSRYPFLATRVSERRGIAPVLERLARTPTRGLAAIVVLDFEFLGDACEGVAARVIAMRDRAAIACIVTRPPPGRRLADRLARMGVFLFDPDAELSRLQAAPH